MKKIRLEFEGEMVKVNRGEGAGGIGNEVVKQVGAELYQAQHSLS